MVRDPPEIPFLGRKNFLNKHRDKLRHKPLVWLKKNFQSTIGTTTSLGGHRRGLDWA